MRTRFARYRIVTPLSSVRLGKDRRGGVYCKLLRHSEVEICGPAALDGMLELKWRGQIYAVFAEDFYLRAELDSDETVVGSVSQAICLEAPRPMYSFQRS